VNSRPTTGDFELAQRVFAYLLETADLGINFYAQVDDQERQHLLAHVDASYGQDLQRRSRSAFVIFFAGGPIAWQSHKQSLTTDSTNYAELVALHEATTRMQALRILTSLVLDSPRFTMCSDSTGVLSVLKTELASTKRTKHIEIRFFSARDFVREHGATLRYVPSENNIADALTKSLDRWRFIQHRQNLLRSCEGA
jgi:hypothetical protein